MKIKGHCLASRITKLISGLFLAIFVAACAVGSAGDFQGPGYIERAELESKDNVTVSAAVLSNAETVRLFSGTIPLKEVRPVWVSIDNQSTEKLLFSPVAFDPDYFAPDEIAWRARNRADGFNAARAAFDEDHLPMFIPARTRVQGFVYAKATEGAKVFRVTLFGDSQTREFEFAQEIPGFKADYLTIDFDQQYDGKTIPSLSLEQLRRQINELPCCALGPDLQTNGDPINLVLVGSMSHILAGLVGSGWDLTETKTGSAILRTIVSSVFRSTYRTSPVSKLFLFGRPQDLALQKARRTVDERNHLRLWRAPFLYGQQEVWVGQISRDIGVKLNSKTFVTHKISPAVDEARDFLLFEAVETGVFQTFAYAYGQDALTPDRPATNYTDDPYFSDGLRLVLFERQGQRRFKEIKMLDWEVPF